MYCKVSFWDILVQTVATRTMYSEDLNRYNILVHLYTSSALAILSTTVVLVRRTSTVSGTGVPVHVG